MMIHNVVVRNTGLTDSVRVHYVDLLVAVRVAGKGELAVGLEPAGRVGSEIATISTQKKAVTMVNTIL